MWWKHLLDVGFSVCFRVMILNFVNVTLKHTTCNSQDLNPLWNSMLKFQSYSNWRFDPNCPKLHPDTLEQLSETQGMWAPGHFNLSEKNSKRRGGAPPWRVERCKCQHRRGATAFRSFRSPWVCSLCVTVLLWNQVRWSHGAMNGVWVWNLEDSSPSEMANSNLAKPWIQLTSFKDIHKLTSTYTHIHICRLCWKVNKNISRSNMTESNATMRVPTGGWTNTWMNEISEWSALRQTVGTLVAEFL